MNSIALYYHFPFCTRKCNYCAFYSVPWATEEMKDKYLLALEKQTASFPESRPVSSIYFGGGTPSSFGVTRLLSLLSFLRQHFTIMEDCEITMEINPCEISLEELLSLFQTGVNRISIGMQSSNDSILKALGRRHRFSHVCNCVQDARRAGFQNISLDLLFGLPDQSLEDVRQSVTDALALSPDHISAYSLQIEEGTPFFVKRNTLNLPSEDLEEEQYDLLCSMLKDHGFRHYEISSFSKGGKESRHNLRYWQRYDYLGFGPAAHSFWNGKRFSNTPDLKTYLSDPLNSNDYHAAETITEEEAYEESVMLSLRTDVGMLYSQPITSQIQRMIDYKLVEVSNQRLRITEHGWRISNAIIGQLLL